MENFVHGVIFSQAQSIVVSPTFQSHRTADLLHWSWKTLSMLLWAQFCHIDVAKLCWLISGKVQQHEQLLQHTSWIMAGFLHHDWIFQQGHTIFATSNINHFDIDAGSMRFAILYAQRLISIRGSTVPICVSRNPVVRKERMKRRRFEDISAYLLDRSDAFRGFVTCTCVRVTTKTADPHSNVRRAT